ncbi:MAG: B12-binding domain-containing radical SAM protein, partial [Clostridia bacterium]|nr:B12-binding domain-containing radical SAM protein [Clostridia bacterium]
MTSDKALSSVLKSVTKPGRYTGNEYNSIVKNPEYVNCRFAFCFPDTYEIGMSNLGVRILYDALNRQDDIWCERVYAPWGDMCERMCEYSLPLVSLESKTPVSEFDLVAFSLQYEMCYTTTLQMLKLAGLNLYSKDRAESDPVIIGGGPCVCNAEPIADFFDLINVGEGEEMLLEISNLYIEMKKNG